MKLKMHKNKNRIGYVHFNSHIFIEMFQFLYSVLAAKLKFYTVGYCHSFN